MNENLKELLAELKGLRHQMSENLLKIDDIIHSVSGYDPEPANEMNDDFARGISADEIPI